MKVIILLVGGHRSRRIESDSLALPTGEQAAIVLNDAKMEIQHGQITDSVSLWEPYLWIKQKYHTNQTIFLFTQLKYV